MTKLLVAVTIAVQSFLTLCILKMDLRVVQSSSMRSLVAVVLLPAGCANKKKIAASHIYQMMLDADVTNVKCLTFANADVAEFNVMPGAKITRNLIKDISLPRGVTIGGLIRDKEAILVTGDTQIQEGDHVVVFCLEGMIKTIEKYFN